MLARLADGLLSYLPSVFWLLGSGTERGEFRSDKAQNGAFMFLRRERVRRRLSVFYVTTEKQLGVYGWYAHVASVLQR